MQKYFILTTIVSVFYGCSETSFNENSKQRQIAAANPLPQTDSGDATSTAPTDPANTRSSAPAATSTSSNNENTGGPYNGENNNEIIDTNGNYPPPDATVPPGEDYPTNPPENPSRPDNAIAHCLKAWEGVHPFSSKPKYRKINVGALLGTLSLVWDAVQTKEPELVYVYSDFSNPLPIAAGAYHLQNPNGWYCLDVNFDKNERYQPGSVASVAGLPVPSLGDVGLSNIVISCKTHLAQVRHTGGDLARFVSILRMHLLPPIPCLDGKDHLLKLDWQLPGLQINGTIF